MSVLIKDLPYELRELAHKRQIEQGNDGKFDGSVGNDRKQGNFNWSGASESIDFWIAVAEGRDVTNHPNYPKSIFKLNFLIL